MLLFAVVTGPAPIAYVRVAELEMVVPDGVPAAQLICGTSNNSPAHALSARMIWTDLVLVKPEITMPPNNSELIRLPIYSEQKNHKLIFGYTGKDGPEAAFTLIS